MKQEDDVREDDQDDLLTERRPQCGNAPVDEFAAIIEGLDAHARRQAWRDLCDFFLHPRDDLSGIGACAHHDRAANDFVTL